MQDMTPRSATSHPFINSTSKSTETFKIRYFMEEISHRDKSFHLVWPCGYVDYILRPAFRITGNWLNVGGILKATTGICQV